MNKFFDVGKLYKACGEGTQFLIEKGYRYCVFVASDMTKAIERYIGTGLEQLAKTLEAIPNKEDITSIYIYV